MRKIAAITMLLALSGCVTAPQGAWYRQSDGQRVDSNSRIYDKFKTDVAICNGEAAQAALQSNEKDRMQHNYEVNLVYDGCLTRRGYVRR